jgi:hypothetical protein
MTVVNHIPVCHQAFTDALITVIIQYDGDHFKT